MLHIPETNPQTPVETTTKPDIYAYIFDFIEHAEKGDKLLYSTPSTFFGYYSMGASNFERVCDALKEAKQHGVEIKLLVDVHDLFSAKAAEGLLTFLTDGREIRHCEGNTDYYGITICNRRGTSRHVAFISERPRSLGYLPGMQIRPFRGIKNDMPTMDQECADSIEAEFLQFWERSNSVAKVVARHTAVYQARKYYVALQVAVYLLVLALGLVIGAAFSYQNYEIVAWLVASIGVGIFGNILTDFFKKRLG